MLFHGYLPPPGIMTEYLFTKIFLRVPNIRLVKQSYLYSLALPARSNAGGQAAAATGQDERSGPSGAEGGFPHSCAQSSLPGPSGADGPQRLGEPFNAKMCLH